MPDPYQGAPALARPERFSITLSRADARFVRAQVVGLGLDGASAFFQRMLSEARGAKLPVVAINGGAK